jgi:hypothetical protein
MRASIEALARHIQNQPHLGDDEKADLLALLENVSEEVDADAPSDQDEPVRETVNLAASVEEQSLPEQWEERLLALEASHPKTAAVLGRIAHALSRMGI